MLGELAQSTHSRSQVFILCHHLEDKNKKMYCLETVSFCSQGLKPAVIPLPPPPKHWDHMYLAQVKNFSKTEKGPGDVAQQWSTQLACAVPQVQFPGPRNSSQEKVRATGRGILLHSQGHGVIMGGRRSLVMASRCPSMPCSVSWLPGVLLLKSGYFWCFCWNHK